MYLGIHGHHRVIASSIVMKNMVLHETNKCGQIFFSKEMRNVDLAKSVTTLAFIFALFTYGGWDHDVLNQ